MFGRTLYFILCLYIGVNFAMELENIKLDDVKDEAKEKHFKTELLDLEEAPQYQTTEAMMLLEKFALAKGVSGDVRLEDGKFPEVFLNGIWSPICGHWFWDTDFGANLFCQRLTSDPASTGHVIRRADRPLEKDAIRIGRCLSNDQWLSCSGGCNDLGTGKGCNNGDNCGANSPASIEIKCNQGTCEDDTNYAASCPYWAGIGECSKNPAFMLVKCKKSCNENCGGGVECPSSHPFAYLNGWYCCQTKEERPTWYNHPKTPQNEIDSGTCDGLDFNRKSRCCKDERNISCSDTNKCFDYVVKHDLPWLFPFPATKRQSNPNQETTGVSLSE